jgi:transcriptional regulator with XRE-family HTH domain
MKWTTKHADRLRNTRVARGVSLREAAGAAGVPNVAFGEWERGRKHPVITDQLRHVATLLDVSLEYLLCETDDPGGPPIEERESTKLYSQAFHDGGGFDLDHIFTYHAPEAGDSDRYNAIRVAARWFAEVIVDHTPPGADQSAAIRKVREAVMTANAAVALKGRLML